MNVRYGSMTFVSQPHLYQCLVCKHEFPHAVEDRDYNRLDQYFMKCPSCGNTEDVGTSYPQNFDVLGIVVG
jgi:DNA-directed RNA polymerase subunit RPC12/RpoP